MHGALFPFDESFLRNTFRFPWSVETHGRASLRPCVSAAVRLNNMRVRNDMRIYDGHTRNIRTRNNMCIYDGHIRNVRIRNSGRHRLTNRIAVIRFDFHGQ